MPSNTIAYLLKFAPREAYIDDLLNGRLSKNWRNTLTPQAQPFAKIWSFWNMPEPSFVLMAAWC